MDTILRKQWGFNGFVVSDYTAIMELRNHGIALDAATAARKALLAGVEVDMMSHYYDTELPALIKSGKVPIAVVDEAVRRVLRVKFALGLFEHPYAEGPEVTSAVAEHRPLVRQGAEESFVLLQNNSVNGKPLLPLAKEGKTVALIGPLADDEAQMVGSWSAGGRQTEVITARKALEERAQQQGSTLLYARGTDIDSTSEAGFAEAVSAAQKADVVVMALGESGEMSSEGGSRSHLDLPGNQQQLLKAVLATGKPVVLLVFSGRALALPWEAEHVPSIMAVWFPGTEAGHALANVLYGDVVPSGKLPVSFPRNVGQEPLYYSDFPTGRPPVGLDLTKFPQGEERFHSRYVDVPNDALFPFGHGLSYTTFGYKDVTVSRAELPLREARGAKPLIVATATVTNTGNVEATEVVECYVRDLGTSLEQPQRSLKGFTRVTLKPGESRRVSFNLGFGELSFFTNEGKAVIEPSEYTVWIGGSSTATLHANFTVTP